MARMTKPRFTPDHRDAAILKQGWRALSRLVGSLDSTAGIHAARRALRVAEALARRLLLVMALTRTPLSARLPQAPAKTDRDARTFQIIETKQTINGTARFRVIETLRFARYFEGPARKYVSGPGPRIRSFDDPPAPQTPAPPDPLLRIESRIAALRHLLADPERGVQRLRRWIARQAARRESGLPGRAASLRPGRPPCLMRFDGLHPYRPPPSEAQGALWDMHLLSHKALTARPP